MNLKELLNKHPHLKPIYQVLKPFLPPANEIKVYYLSELPKFGFTSSDTVIACALPPDKLFFREIPPSEYDLAHELIHLCRKYQIAHEEVYGYNLAPVVLFCAKEKLFNVNVFKLFELTEDQINSVLQKYGYESIEDFYTQQGVIPTTHKLLPTPKGQEKLLVGYRMKAFAT